MSERHRFTPDSTGQFCAICGSGVWGIHRFEPDEGIPYPPAPSAPGHAVAPAVAAPSERETRDELEWAWSAVWRASNIFYNLPTRVDAEGRIVLSEREWNLTKAAQHELEKASRIIKRVAALSHPSVPEAKQ